MTPSRIPSTTFLFSSFLCLFYRCGFFCFSMCPLCSAQSVAVFLACICHTIQWVFKHFSAFFNVSSMFGVFFACMFSHVLCVSKLYANCPEWVWCFLVCIYHVLLSIFSKHFNIFLGVQQVFGISLNASTMCSFFGLVLPGLLGF